MEREKKIKKACKLILIIFRLTSIIINKFDKKKEIFIYSFFVNEFILKYFLGINICLSLNEKKNLIFIQIIKLFNNN